MMKIDMRDAFFEELLEAALKDERIVVLSADHGAFALEKLKSVMPDRYINVGIAEQNMVGVAAGLAASGKIVFIYGISPFVSLRVLEQLTIDVAATQLPVNVISVGAGFTYSTDGPTHQGLQDVSAVASIPGMGILNSSDPANTRAFVNIVTRLQRPHYIRVEKEKLCNLPRSDSLELSLGRGYSILGDSESKIVIITTGFLSQVLLPEIRQWGNELGESFCLIDIHQIRPFPDLAKFFRNQTHVLVIEEAYESIIAPSILRILNQIKKTPEFFIADVGPEYQFPGASREFMMDQSGLSPEKLRRRIAGFIGKDDQKGK